MTRKEKEKEFFAHHMDKFRKAQVTDPFFAIKTAFFQKGKFGRQVQLFEGELKRGEDIYIEFIEVNRDASGKEIGVEPAFEDRPLFKYKYNPYFAEEYDVKEGTNSMGENYFAYTIPLSELMVVLPDGSEITQNLYEKRKAEAPKEQVSLSVFPDFEDEFIPKLKENVEDLQFVEKQESASHILLRIAEDFQKLAQKLK
jgi:hypothetical protein